MKIFRVSAAFLMTPLAWGSSSRELPEWNAKLRLAQEAEGLYPGALLLTNTSFPDAPEISAMEPLKVEAPRPEEIVNDLAVIPMIDAKFFQAYFGVKPKSFLVDPQNLLTWRWIFMSISSVATKGFPARCGRKNWLKGYSRTVSRLPW
jgi:hypothetical protein